MVVVKGGTFWRPVRFGTCGELQRIGRLGAKREGVPWRRKSALSECHWEELGGGDELLTFGSYLDYPTGLDAISVPGCVSFISAPGARLIDTNACWACAREKEFV